MDNCIFCKIANGEIPTSTVYEDEDFRAFLDLGPATNGHTLIVPKKHVKDVTELDQETAGKALILAAKIGEAMKVGLGCTGFNLVINTGESAGQTIFHFHLHVIPRYDNGEKIVEWVPGNNTDEEREQILSKIRSALA